MQSRDCYFWSNNRPDIPDARVVAKTNDEYHAYQTLAGKHVALKEYKKAAEYFKLAYDSRLSLLVALHQLQDDGHINAKNVVKRLFDYYKALFIWEKSGNQKDTPTPEEFNLPKRIIQKIELEGCQLLIKEYQRHAAQYASIDWYEDAALFYKKAIAQRKVIMANFPHLKTNLFVTGYNTITRLYKYYTALTLWQNKEPVTMKNVPQPEEFNLTPELVKRVEQAGQKILETAYGSRVSSRANPTI